MFLEMVADLSEEMVFSCARTLFLEDGELSLQVSAEGISVKFPTTRRIAERIGVPHYYVLPYVAALESDGFLIRKERIGVFTTSDGTRRLFSGMYDGELSRLRYVCGDDLYRVLLSV